MRFLVAVVSAGAALTLIVASGLMNWVFMTSLGKSEFEQQILGAVSIAVSAFLALLPTLLLWAYRERRTLYMFLGVPVFLAFAAFSLSSAVGFAAKNRGSLSEDRTLAAAKLAGLMQEVEEVGAKLKALPPFRPFSVLQESLRGLEQDRRWQSSKFCADATADASRSFCKGYFELKAEAARASEAERLEARIAGLKAQSRQLEEQGASREADNQAAVLARLLGAPVAKVERALMLFLALLVEVGAALGLFFATGHIRSAGSPDAPRGRGVTVIEGGAVREVSGVRLLRAPVKQIAGPVPRRVPRISRS
ncbi:MAG: hypothetical protein ACLQF2_20455 [Rhodomicrobium sp.]